MAQTSSSPIRIILLCARFDEALEARRTLLHLQLRVESKFYGKIVYHSVDFPDLQQHPLHLEIYSCVDQAGGDTASAVTTHLLEHVRPHWLFMTGVCAGRADKTALGDLIIADRAVNYRAGKIVDGGQIQHGSQVPSLNQYLRQPMMEIAAELKGQWSILVPTARPWSQRI